MSDKEILNKAIGVAVDQGWKNDLGYTVIDVMGYAMLHQRHLPPQIMDDPASLLFNHEFAKALFGTDEVDNHGQDIKTIRLWANQVAVKHAGKLYEVDPEKRFGAIAEMPELSTLDLSEPTSVVEARKVEYQLQRMTGQVSFETFKLLPLEIEADTLPAYKHHLREMVTVEDPIAYLRLYFEVTA